jgi:hypothetical protein
MPDSTDEFMKSYEVINSVVMRRSRYDTTRILMLNLATCNTADSLHDEIAALARFAAVTDMMKEDPDAVRGLLKRRAQS